MNHLMATAGIAFIDTLRQMGFWVGGLCFLAAAVLSALPISAGLPADPQHHMDAGLSTLLLGGVFLSIVLLPSVLSSRHGARLSHDRIRILPIRSWAWIGGIYLGFCSGLLFFFVLGGTLLASVQLITREPGQIFYLSGLGLAFFVSLLAAALILCLFRFLPCLPAMVAAVVVICLGHLADGLPLPLAILLPAFGSLDPSLLNRAPPQQILLALVHGFAFIGLYLCLASGFTKLTRN